MRIAGINSSNYQLNPTQKPQNHSSSGSSGQLVRADGAGPRADRNTIPENPPNVVTEPVTQQNGALMQASAKSVVRNRGNGEERVEFYSRGDVPPPRVWNAYASDSDGRSNDAAVPDTTSHKARLAISEYLQTQYLEERQRFEQALGVDEYA